MDRGAVGVEDDENEASFYKILHGTDLSSDSMRKIPSEFLSCISQRHDFKLRAVLKVAWGRSWTVRLSKLRGCVFFAKHDWEEFISDNSLGDKEFLVFTNGGQMILNVKIFLKDGMQTLRSLKPETTDPPKGQPVLVSVEKKEPEEDVSKFEGGEEQKRNPKRKKPEAEERESLNDSRTHRPQARSCFIAQFNIEIKKSYLHYVTIPALFIRRHLPEESKNFVIRHSNGKTWEVTYLNRGKTGTLSKGWTRLAREIGLHVGDLCTLKLINADEIVIHVSKAGNQCLI